MGAKFTGYPKGLGIDLERCSTAQEHELGLVVEGLDAGGLACQYRYVKFLDAVTYVAGHVVGLASATTWSVTNDRSGGSDLALIPVGVVFQSTVPTQNQYGWVQCSGIATCLIEGAAVVAGDCLVLDGSNDGAISEADYTGVAHVDLRSCAIAMATIADGATGKCLLTNLI